MKFIFFILICLLPTRIFAQELSISKMIDYYLEDDWQKVNIDLIQRGWIFDNISPGDEEEGQYHIIMWTYGKQNYDDVIRLFVLPDTPPRVFFATLNLNSYLEIMSQLAPNNFDLIETNYTILDARSTYGNKDYKLTISVANHRAAYTFVLNKK